MAAEALGQAQTVQNAEMPSSRHTYETETRRFTVVKRGDAVPSGSFQFQIIHGRGYAVDPESQRLTLLFKEAERRACRAEHVSLDVILKAVCEAVEGAMPIKYEHKLIDMYIIENNERIRARQDGRGEAYSIDEFIEARAGVCRHKGPVAAALTKRLMENFRMGGEVRINIGFSTKTGHAWVSYRCADGQRYIIDPELAFVGSVSESGRIVGQSLNQETGEWGNAAPPWNYRGLLQRAATAAALSVVDGLSKLDGFVETRRLERNRNL